MGKKKKKSGKYHLISIHCVLKIANLNNCVADVVVCFWKLEAHPKPSQGPHRGQLLPSSTPPVCWLALGGQLFGTGSLTTSEWADISTWALCCCSAHNNVFPFVLAEFLLRWISYSSRFCELEGCNTQIANSAAEQDEFASTFQLQALSLPSSKSAKW